MPSDNDHRRAVKIRSVKLLGKDLFDLTLIRNRPGADVEMGMKIEELEKKFGVEYKLFLLTIDAYSY